MTHLVRLWLYYVRKCHLWNWSWQKILLFVCFGLNYMNYCLILFFGVSESSINCYCLILLVFLFVYLYLFGLNRGLKILFDLFWLPKSPLLAMPDTNHRVFFKWNGWQHYWLNNSTPIYSILPQYKNPSNQWVVDKQTQTEGNNCNCKLQFYWWFAAKSPSFVLEHLRNGIGWYR